MKECTNGQWLTTIIVAYTSVCIAHFHCTDAIYNLWAKAELNCSKKKKAACTVRMLTNCHLNCHTVYSTHWSRKEVLFGGAKYYILCAKFLGHTHQRSLMALEGATCWCLEQINSGKPAQWSILLASFWLYLGVSVIEVNLANLCWDITLRDGDY